MLTSMKRDTASVHATCTSSSVSTTKTPPRLYEEKFGQPFPKQLVDLKEGDAVFVDLDGNGIINEDDKTRDLGYTDDPQYVAGLNAGFAWKDFEFNMQWTGSWDVSRVISDVFRYPFLDRTTKDRGGLLKYHLENTWNPEKGGQDYEYPRATWTNGATNNYQDCALYEKARSTCAEDAYACL